MISKSFIRSIDRLNKPKKINLSQPSNLIIQHQELNMWSMDHVKDHVRAAVSAGCDIVFINPSRSKVPPGLLEEVRNFKFPVRVVFEPIDE